MNWLAAALAAPALWSVITIIDHNLINKVYPSALFGTIISAIFAGFPALLLFAHFDVPIFFALVATFAGCVSVYQFYTYFLALKQNSPSLVVAFYNLAAVFVPIFSFVVIGELMSWAALTGFLFVLVPSIVMNFYSIDHEKKKTSIRLMMTTTILYSCSLVAMKYVYENISFEAGFGYFSLGHLIGIIILMIYSSRARKVFTEARSIGFGFLLVLFAIEAISVMADVFQNIAISLGSVSLVVALEGAQPIFVLLLSIIFYPLFPKLLPEALEGNKFIKFACMSLMIYGIFIISQASF